MQRVLVVFIFYMFFNLFNITAEDIVLYEKGQSALDSRVKYKNELIRQALIHTESDFGPFKFLTTAPVLNTIQAMKQIKTGKILNVFIALTTPDWELYSIPIRIPIRKGLLSYRLLLIHKDDLGLYANIKTLEQLKSLTVGLQLGWTTRLIMEKSGFDIITGTSYDGLFHMLNNKRFHYIPRGVNEIYGEIEARESNLHNLMIEPNLALYINSPTYIFVSKKYPELAKRLEIGMERMVENGTLDRLFTEYYNDNIQKADLKTRHIIEIPNDFLPYKTPLNRDELWFDPLK
jgi:hypothetical protein